MATVVDGDQKAPFSIAATSRCKGGTTPFHGFLHFTFDMYLILLSVKQGCIKYHIYSLRYNATWDWTQASQTIGKHSTCYTRKLCYNTYKFLSSYQSFYRSCLQASYSIFFLPFSSFFFFSFFSFQWQFMPSSSLVISFLLLFLFSIYLSYSILFSFFFFFLFLNSYIFYAFFLFRYLRFTSFFYLSIYLSWYVQIYLSLFISSQSVSIYLSIYLIFFLFSLSIKTFLMPYSSLVIFVLRLSFLSIYLRGSLNKVPDFFRMGTFIDTTHMKL